MEENYLKHSFSGYIRVGEEICFCTVNDFSVKILPVYNNDYSPFQMISKIRESFSENPEFKKCFLEGITENNRDFRVLLTEPPQFPPLGFYASFGSPLIIMGKSNMGILPELSYFDAIKFSGDSVNIVYNPKIALKHSGYSKESPGVISIETKPFSDYTKEYDVSIDGQKAKLKFSIEQDGKSGDMLTPELGSLTSVIRLEFDEKQPLNMIENSYIQMSGLIKFLVGRQNVRFGTSLMQKDKSGRYETVAECFIHDGYEDSCNVRFHNAISLTHLGNKLPNLYKLFGEKDKSPYLNFLPRSNKEAPYVSYTDVYDICTALEKEYGLKKYKAPLDAATEKLLDKLKTDVKECKSTDPNGNDRLYDAANSSIGYINFPLAERIWYLCEQSLDTTLTKEKRDKLKEDVVAFVKLRNKSAHDGIVNWGESTKILTTLLRTFYCAVLTRADYSTDEAKRLACQKWQCDSIVI